MNWVKFSIYDHQVLEIIGTTKEELFKINYEEAMLAVHGLREKFGGSSLFGTDDCGIKTGGKDMVKW